MRKRIMILALLGILIFGGSYTFEQILGPDQVKIYNIAQSSFIYSPETYPSFDNDSVYARFYLMGINRYAAQYDSVQMAVWSVAYPFSDKTIGTPVTTLIVDTIYLWTAASNVKDTTVYAQHATTKQWSHIGYKALIFASRGTSDSATTWAKFVGEASFKKTP
jgi:hypothetical protein